MVASILLTPIQILVEECDVRFSPITMILLVCDCLRLIDWIKAVSNDHLDMVSLVSLLSIPACLAQFSMQRDLVCLMSWMNTARMMCYWLAGKHFADLRLFLHTQCGFSVKDSTTSISCAMFTGIMYIVSASCVWYYLGFNDTAELTWASLKPEMVSTIWSRLSLSLYFILISSFTIGYGDIYPVSILETMFSIFVVFNAQIILAYLISMTTSYLTNRDVIRNQFRDEMNLIQTYMTNRNECHDDMESMFAYYNYLFGRQLGLPESRFLSVLPKGCSRQLVEQLAGQIRQVPLFRNSALLRSRCLDKLEFRTYAPGSSLFALGDMKRELILVRSGRIELFREDCARAARIFLVCGDFYGDYSLLFDSPCELYGKASGFTEVLVLTFDNFDSSLRECGLIQAADALTGHPEDRSYAGLELCSVATEKCYDDLMRKFDKVAASVEKSTGNKRMTMMMKLNSIRLRTRGSTIMPSDSIRLVWDCCCLLGLLYHLLFVPLRVCLVFKCNFERSHEECSGYWNYSLAGDYLVDCLFVADIILRSRFFAYKTIENQMEQVITNPQDIRTHFWLSRRLKLDLVSIIPVDIGAAFVGSLVYWRLSRVVSVLLVSDIVPGVLDFISAEYQSTVSTEARFVLYLSIVTVLTIFWTSLSWDMMHFGNDAEDLLSSLYWCLTTMTTTGLTNAFMCMQSVWS
jgi:hypothetical protein